jgi:GNAT superfamily N-acetyltransferase
MPDMPALREIYRRASLSNEGDRDALLAHPEALVLGDRGVVEGRMKVAAVGARIVGFITTDTTVDRPGFLELEDLFVDPDWMRQGIGRAMVEDVVQSARERGIDRIEVDGNRHALQFYRRVGFVVDHEVETEFGTGLRMHLTVAG